jgi:PHD/YefM family antitoxin component YafN of YafNO toxin-antitoxin module
MKRIMNFYNKGLVSDTPKIEQDETAYLLADPENKARLLAAIENVENNCQLVQVDIEKLIATD